MQCSACGVMSDLHHESLSAFCTFEGWRMENKIKRSLQYWLGWQLPQQPPHPQVSPNKPRGNRKVGLIQRDQNNVGSGYCALLIIDSLTRVSVEKAHPSGAFIHCRGQVSSLLTLVLLCLSARARELGRLLKIEGISSTFFIVLFCLNHLSTEKVDLEEAWHKEKNNKAAEGCWIFNPITLCSSFSIIYFQSSGVKRLSKPHSLAAIQKASSCSMTRGKLRMSSWKKFFIGDSNDTRN